MVIGLDHLATLPLIPLGVSSRRDATYDISLWRMGAVRSVGPDLNHQLLCSHIHVHLLPAGRTRIHMDTSMEGELRASIGYFRVHNQKNRHLPNLLDPIIYARYRPF